MIRFATASLVVLCVIQLAGCPYVTIPTATEAHVQTSLGEFVIELDAEQAPITVDNFITYVEDDFYDGTVFHRVIPGFVVQGGGLTPNLVEKETRPPIVNESFNGLSNVRGTVAMARTEAPDSATSQFFVNLVDNTALDATATQAGYAVFGRVIEGMDVIDRIATVQTEERDGFTDVPVEDAVIENIELIELLAGCPELTPEGETYVETRRFTALALARDLVVQLLGFGIWGAFGGI
jgi:cyclophilin family peptidyl-prolyl cis-trans isomerase